MKAYKLTNHSYHTHSRTKWGKNVTHTAKVVTDYLCSGGWIHFYRDPLIAVVMNCRHADFLKPVLWECETSGEHKHEALKSGCRTLTTIKRIRLPKVSRVQLIAFAILCVKRVYKEKQWNKWANRWLSGKDRSKESALATKDSIMSSYPTSLASDAAWKAARAASIEYSDIVVRHVAGVVMSCSVFNSKINFSKIANKALTYK